MASTGPSDTGHACRRTASLSRRLEPGGIHEGLANQPAERLGLHPFQGGGEGQGQRERRHRQMEREVGPSRRPRRAGIRRHAAKRQPAGPGGDQDQNQRAEERRRGEEHDRCGPREPGTRPVSVGRGVEAPTMPSTAASISAVVARMAVLMTRSRSNALTGRE